MIREAEPHGLVNGKTVTDEHSLVQELIDLLKENPPEIEIDDMSCRHQQFLETGGIRDDKPYTGR